MSTWNMEIRELIENSRVLDKQLNKIGWEKQYVRGKKRVCCNMCGTCPSAIADYLEDFLQDVEGTVESQAKKIDKLTRKLERNNNE